MDSRIGTNPIEKDRKTTDLFFNFVYLFIVLLWLGMGISVFVSHERVDKNDDFAEIKSTFQDLKLLITAPFQRFSYELILLLFLTAALIMVFLILIEKFTKFFAWIGIVLFMISTFLTGSRLVYHIIEGDEIISISVTAVTWFFLQVIPTIVGIIGLHKIGMDIPCHVIKESCRVILHSPLLILLHLLFLILEYLISMVIATTLLRDILSDRNEYLIAFSMCINIFCGLIVLSYHAYFVYAVTSHYAINYYWKIDEKPRIGESIILVVKYHMGTIVFAAITPIALIWGLIEAIIHKPSWERKENYIFYLITKIYLTMRMPIKVLSIVSIYGTTYAKSAQKTFDTILRRCSLYFAIHWIIGATMIVMGIVFTVGAMVAGMTMPHKDTEDRVTLFLILYGIGSPVILFSILLHNVAKALSINQIIVSNTQD